MGGSLGTGRAGQDGVKAEDKWNGQVPHDDHARRQGELPRPGLTGCGRMHDCNDVLGLTKMGNVWAAPAQQA